MSVCVVYCLYFSCFSLVHISASIVFACSRAGCFSGVHLNVFVPLEYWLLCIVNPARCKRLAITVFSHILYLSGYFCGLCSFSALAYDLFSKF